MATNVEIADYFTECSVDYRRFWTDENNLAMHFGFWEPNTENLHDAMADLNRILAEKAKIKADDVVLDAGCGLGGSSIWLAKNLGVKVACVSICKKDIEDAEKSAQECHVDHLVIFHHEDMVNTEFEDRSFDVIWAIESIVHIDDKRKFFLEAFRLLKDGGRLIIADGFLGKDRSEFNKKQLDALEKIEKGWAITIVELDEYIEHMEDSGFTNIQFEDTTNNIMKSSWHIYIRGVILYPIALLLKWLGLRTERGVYNSIACRKQYSMFSSGNWRYGIIYAEK